MENTVAWGRALIGDSLGFHLFIIIFGVGMPILISAIELFGILTKRPKAQALAKTWSKALVILFIVGAVSGTLISLQLNLLWPKFMDFIGETAGLAFVLEGTMFMIEAVFMGVYMLTWKRFKPIWHWACSIPIVIGSIGSAIFITSANAFMNYPQGFDFDAAGNPINVNVMKALFTPITFSENAHSLPAYFTATALVILSIYIWLFLKKRHEADRPWMKKLIIGLAAYALFWGIVTASAGHMAGQFLAKYEPRKLAAAEALYETQTKAPLLVGGIVSDGEVKYGLTIPWALSILAGNTPNTEVKGLNDYPVETRPPIIIHYFFDGMVMLGTLIITIPLAFLIMLRWRPQWAFRKPTMYVLMACGAFSVIAAELGWMLTEIGRQPYAVNGYLLTKDAFTKSETVIHMGILFPIGYVVLLGLSVLVLRKLMNNNAVRDIK